jgi:hypothetical protein
MESREGNGVDGTHKILDDDHPGANNQTSYQPNGEGMTVEPIGVEPEKDRGQGLDNPDAAEQLEVDGIGGR